MSERLQCSPENAARFADWIATRGGVAVWRSVNLSNPGASWSTPALAADGKPMARPTWEVDNKPERVVMSADDVDVTTGREVKRVKIALRRGDGLSIVLTSHSSKKLRAACDAAGPDSWYEFDGMGYALVFVPGEVVELSAWVAARGAV